MDKVSNFTILKNENNNAKEILNSLLKGMLEHKLNKLEKKNIEESNSLKIMSKISQNIIITLDHYSHKVRKEIYKQRHKNDESHRKKNELESYKKNIDMNKTIYKDEKNNRNNLDNNIELLINKSNKNLFDYSSQHKKRPSKSIDPKKDKNFFTEINSNLNPKEKSVKKEKMDVFARLTSKSIGNFKKMKLGLNENMGGVPLYNSKTKNKKSNYSSKALNNILNKKNEGEKTSEHSPSNKDSSANLGEKSKLLSTPKKQKLLKRIENPSYKNLITDTSKNKIKKTNSKGKFPRRSSKASTGVKKEEIHKIIDKRKSKNDISSDINKNVNENKIPEIKTTNTNEDKNEIINENNNKEAVSSNKNVPVQRSIKERLLMDDDMLNNVNKDELLVSKINEEEKMNEINEISQINFDDINLKDSLNFNLSLKESINLNLENNQNNQITENNQLTKKNNIEIKSSVNSLNKNNIPINNIKTISSNNQNLESNQASQSNSNSNKNQSQNNTNENNKTSKSNNNINNIIISNPKKNPTNFLDNDNEINFTLIEDSHIDENDNDFNKTIDLNISGLSDQLSLGEKFETHIDEISRFLDIKDLCNIMLLNKECFTNIMNALISKTEITIDILEEEINKLKDANKDIDFTKITIQPFKLSSNSSRAISLLNNTSDCNLIKFGKNHSINREIFIVFGIFFIAAGKKKEFLKLSGEEEKINYISNYFKKDIEKMSLGSLIEKEINGKIFDDDIISSLYRYSNKHINIISPSKFQKTNKDVAIFVFVVKNILEHIGILDQQNIKPDKEYILYNARLNSNRIKLDELNNFSDKIC